jgi:TolB-like protein/class 3 adenylate cyclase/Tfp pilus assembly protein PilF
MERRLSAILAADVVRYSALMEMDEAGTFERLRAHRKELFEPQIEKHHGRIFKLTGDGLFAEFSSVVDAVECAVSVQRGLRERNANLPENKRIHVRIGINLGEVIVEGDDRLGEGVNIAARLEQLAEPGGICVSGKVTKEVEKKLALGFEPMGEQTVKNISEPIPVYRVKMEGTPRRRPTRRQTRPWTWAAVILAVIVPIAGLWFYFAQPKSASATVPAIAVLPFDNMSDDAKLSYFSDGVSEDIISMLARSPDLSVVARNSSFTYKGKATDVRQIGKELGVAYLLEGSVRKEADKVRIVAQLIDTKTGEHVWAERFDETGPDPWKIQDEVTSKIIGALAGEKGKLKQAQYRDAWGKDSSNLQEYDFYLRGHDLFMQFEKESLERAAEIWREGLTKFPDSPLLQLKLGWYHWERAWDAFGDTPELDYRRAGELVRRAFSYTNLSPLEQRLGHWLLAFVNVHEGNFDEALKQLQQAVELAPYDAWMIGNLSQILIMAGRPVQAIEWLDKSIKGDPINKGGYLYKVGWALTVKQEPEKAIAVLRNAEVSTFTLALLAINHIRLNRINEARAAIKKLLSMEPSFTLQTWRNASFYQEPELLNREIADLEKAGLPAK